MKKIRKLILFIFVPIICLGLGIGLALPKSFALAEINGGALYIGNNSTFTLDGNKSLSGFSADKGGAIYVSDGGTLKISGGDVFANSAQVGAGIYYDSSKVFQMTAGTVSGNSGSASIYLNKGTFNLSGGTISGNRSDESEFGGAVYVGKNATMNMSGGSITSNSNNNGLKNGNVIVEGNFKMTGGAVVENKYNGENLDIVSYNNGNIIISAGTVGVVHALGSGSFTMNGGMVGTIVVGSTSLSYFYGGNVLNKIVVENSIELDNSFGDNTTFEIKNNSSTLWVLEYDGTTRAYNIVLSNTRGVGTIATFNATSESGDVAPDLSKIKVSGYDDTKYKVAIEKDASGNWILVLQSVEQKTFDSDWADQLSFNPTKVSFLSEVPSGYVYEKTMTSGIKMFKNSSLTTEIAFVHGNTIFAPTNSSYLFAGKIFNGDALTRKSKITEFVFENFDASKTTNMSYMFYSSNVKNANLTFTDDSVLKNSYMFGDCVNLETVSFGDGWKSVGDLCFYNCSELKQVLVPNSVTEIKEHAFIRCTALNEISLPLAWGDDYNIFDGSGVKKVILTGGNSTVPRNCFFYNKTIETVELHDNVLTLDVGAFVGSALKNIDLKNVQYINGSAFQNCSNLQSVLIPKSVQEIGSYAFTGSGIYSLSFEERTTEIALGQYMFQNCKNLTSIYLPSWLKSVPVGMFYGCVGLNAVSFPDGLLKIEAYSFASCSSLVALNISESVSSIDGSAFVDCSGLKSVKMPVIGNSLLSSLGVDTVEIIGTPKTIPASYFASGKITKLILPESVETLGASVFSYSTLKILVAEGLTAISQGAFRNCTNLETYTVPSKVSVIAVSAFEYCTNLKTIELPSSLGSIGDSAFKGCSDLTEISIPMGVSIGNTVFEGATSLKKVKMPLRGITLDSTLSNVETIEYIGYIESVPESYFKSSSVVNIILPSSVKTINNSAFSYCKKLKSVKADGVTELGENAFLECLSLEFYNAPSGLLKIGKNAFGKCNSLVSVKLPDGLESIGAGAFSKCDSLTSFTIPGTVTSMGQNIFAYSTNLEVVTMPVPSQGYVINSTLNVKTIIFNGGNESIPELAFEGCVNLENVIFNGFVKSVGYAAFQGCTSLKEIDLSGVTNIGAYAFQNCTSYKTLVVPASIMSIGDGAFNNTAIAVLYFEPWPQIVSLGIDVFHSCSKLSQVTFNARIIDMPQSMFYGCTSLKSISIPYRVTTFGKKLFRKCSNLESVTFTGNEVAISDQMFSECSNLSSITIPSTVTSIGDSAFEKCTKLTIITIPANVTRIGAKAFDQTGLTAVGFEKSSGWTATKDGSSVSLTLNGVMSNAIYLKTTYVEYVWQRASSSSFISLETKKDENISEKEYETAILPNDKKGIKISIEKVEKE